MILEEEYQRIKDNHRRAMIARVARVCFSGSTSRVFPKAKSKNEKSANDIIKEALRTIDVDTLPSFKTQEEFRLWFEEKLKLILDVIPQRNSHGKILSEGSRKWGYGAKILCLFLRDMIENCLYFSVDKVEETRKCLYVPIDDIIINKLGECGVTLPFSKIKEIDSSEKFYLVQNILGQVSEEIGVPRIWFDDNWGDRQ
jgi:hypothetical protein